MNTRIPSSPSKSSKPGRNDPCSCGSGKKYKACCQKSTAKPAETAALLNQARQALAQGDRINAQMAFRLVLAIEPGHPQALADLGQALCRWGRVREGLSYLRQAAQQVEIKTLHSGDIRFAVDLAEQLFLRGDFDLALRLIERVIQSSPDLLTALNKRVHYLSRLDRVDEALLHAQAVSERFPDQPASQNQLAIVEARSGKPAEARARFESVIAAHRDAEQTARAWQELANLLDKQGEYRQAFDAYGEAKTHYLKLAHFRHIDRQFIFACIERNQSGFDATLLKRWSVEDYADALPRPVFLMGFLRSGTTLTEQVLGAHPGIIASDESSFMGEITDKLAHYGEDMPSALRRIDLRGARQLRAHYWQRVREEHGDDACKQLFVDKVALNSIDIGVISVLFPEAKILFALRDPRDVCLSCLQQVFEPSVATVNLLSWEGIARQYAAVMGLWLQLRNSIAPAYLQLRYEDTVNDFETTFRKVFAFLELEWMPEVVAFHEKAKSRHIVTPSFAAVTQPLYQTAVERWRNYAPHYPAILPWLERFILEFGYR